MTHRIDLQAHPFFESYDIDSVFDAMGKNNLDIVALQTYNRHNFPTIKRIAQHTKYTYRGDDDFALQVSKENKNFYMIRSIELVTEDYFHLIVLGSENVTPYQDTRTTIETALADDALVIFDHPFVNNRNVGKEISEQKEEDLINICEQYSGKIALEWNGYCKPITRKLIGGRDVNKDVEKLSADLKRRAYNVPVVADTDLHARNKRLLQAIGIASIETSLDTSSGKAMFTSLKKNIFSDNYSNNKNYVSMLHFVEAFGLPILFPRYFKRPRG